MDHVHQDTKYTVSWETAFHEQFRWLVQVVLRVPKSPWIFSVLSPVEYISGFDFRVTVHP